MDICQNKCDIEPKCIGFSREKAALDSENRMCYLKQSAPSVSYNNRTWDTYVKLEKISSWPSTATTPVPSAVNIQDLFGSVLFLSDIKSPVTQMIEIKDMESELYSFYFYVRRIDNIDYLSEITVLFLKDLNNSVTSVIDKIKFKIKVDFNTWRRIDSTVNNISLKNSKYCKIILVNSKIFKAAKCIANSCGVLISGISLFAGNYLPLPNEPSLASKNLIPNGNFTSNIYWEIYNADTKQLIPINNFPKIQNNTLQFRQDVNTTQIPSIVSQMFVLPVNSENYILNLESLFKINYIFDINLIFLDISENTVKVYNFLYYKYNFENLDTDVWIFETRDVNSVPSNAVYCKIEINDNYKDKKQNQPYDKDYSGPTIKNLELIINL